MEDGNGGVGSNAHVGRPQQPVVGSIKEDEVAIVADGQGCGGRVCHRDVGVGRPHGRLLRYVAVPYGDVVVAGAGGGGGVTLGWGVEAQGELVALGHNLLRPGQRCGGVDGVDGCTEKDLAE